MLLFEADLLLLMEVVMVVVELACKPEQVRPALLSLPSLADRGMMLEWLPAPSSPE